MKRVLLFLVCCLLVPSVSSAQGYSWIRTDNPYGVWAPYVQPQTSYGAGYRPDIPSGDSFRSGYRPEYRRPSLWYQPAQTWYVPSTGYYYQTPGYFYRR